MRITIKRFNPLSAKAITCGKVALFKASDDVRGLIQAYWPTIMHNAVNHVGWLIVCCRA